MPKQLPHLNPERLGNSFDRRNPEPRAASRLNVLKMPYRYAGPLGGGFLAPSARKPRIADVRAEGGNGRHPTILGCCLES